jgi:glycine C-acetyltransferase/8-amino-7-oxononanoate synthase
MNPDGDCSLNQFLLSGLEEIESRGLTRRLSALEGPQQTRVVRNGRELLNFSSNDYLGLATHPDLKTAAMAEWERSGFGSGASRLICGTLAAHEELDHAIAEFKQTAAALSFSSGYAAAMGTIPALCGAGDVIILDKLSHACLVDAAHLSGAALRVFPHNDLGKLESHLKWASAKHPDGKKLIIAESIYSMDGDRSPLREIVELKERHGAWIFLDEAHAVGVIGRQGRGLADEEGIADHIEIQMGTLGKALGSHGAYIAGSRPLREIAASPEGDALRAKLWTNLHHLQSLLSTKAVESAIFPILIGNESHAVETSTRLLNDGFLVPAIRFPTVAKGSARLRVTLTASHLKSEIESLVQALPIQPLRAAE